MCLVPICRYRRIVVLTALAVDWPSPKQWKLSLCDPNWITFHLFNWDARKKVVTADSPLDLKLSEIAYVAVTFSKYCCDSFVILHVSPKYSFVTILWWLNTASALKWNLHSKNKSSYINCVRHWTNCDNQRFHSHGHNIAHHIVHHIVERIFAAVVKLEWIFRSGREVLLERNEAISGTHPKLEPIYL